MADVPQWHAKGDWFDVCKCSIPCPCTFAQPPTDGQCEGILAWHIGAGRYGGVDLSGLSVVALGAFTGNLWAGAKAQMAIYIDARADASQRQAIEAIWGGQAGVRTGPGRDLGSCHHRSGRRLRFQVAAQREVEQALPLRLERSGISRPRFPCAFACNRYCARSVIGG